MEAFSMFALVDRGDPSRQFSVHETRVLLCSGAMAAIALAAIFVLSVWA
jgi:hypothetical protein